MGLKAQLTAEMAQSSCLRDLGFAALAGAVSYKSYVNYQKLQREKQLIDLGAWAGEQYRVPGPSLSVSGTESFSPDSE